MEQVRTARRSASHGSMPRRYAANTGLSPRMIDSNPFARRPLRSVNENICLLPSPGPLESMLKTTTETGDIGLFSISPSRSTANFRRPLYAQSDSEDQNRQRPSRGNVLGHRSASSSFSQSLDDLSQRTYSMTSCSSRPISNKKSNGTLQSQSSGNLLQRPRSPFPYPSRLKRPGVRPSSPAWTDNGGVDYSRVMQIDRLPHRTVRDLRKPSYAHSDRRSNPGLSRRHANRSVSLPSSTTLAGIKMPSEQISNTPTTRSSKYRGRLDSGKSDNSFTSSSATSIGGIYRPSYPPPAQNHHSRTQSGGVVFYDYSENFELAPPVVKPSLAPFAPTPTRAPSLHRHMLLDERYTIRCRSADTQHYDQALRASSPMESDSKQDSPNSRQNHLPPAKPLLDASPGLSPDGPMNSQAYLCSEDSEKGQRLEETRSSSKSSSPSSDLIAASMSDLACAQSPPEKSTTQQHVVMEVKSTGNVWADQNKTDRELFKAASLERYGLAYEEYLHPSAPPQTRLISHPTGISRSISLSCETQESASYTFSNYLRRSKSQSVESGSSTLVSPVRYPEPADARTSVAYHACSDEVTVHLQHQSARRPRESSKSRYSPTHHADISLLPFSTSKPSGDLARGQSNELHELRTNGRHYGFSSPNVNASLGSAAGDHPPETEYALPISAAQPVSHARRLELQNSEPQLMEALPMSPPPRDSILSANELLAAKLDFRTSISPRPRGDNMAVIRERTEGGRISKSSNGRLRFKVPRHGIPKISTAPIPLGTTMGHHILEDDVTVVSPFTDGDGPPSSPAQTASELKYAATEIEESFIGEPSSPQRTIHSASLASTSDLRSTFSDGPAGSHKPPRGLQKRVSDLRTRLVESRLKSTEYQESPGRRNTRDGAMATSSHAHTSATGGADDSHRKGPVLDDLEYPPAASRGFRVRMAKWMTAARESVMAACTGSRKRG